MSTPAPTEQRRGRRPGETDARKDIEDAARESFARDGYAATSLRGVARAAGVDPALIRHYFRNKEGLFAGVIRPPIDPARAVERISGAGPERIGVELATVVAEILDDAGRSQQVVAIVRAAVSEPEGAQLLRDTLTQTVVKPIVDALDTTAPERRAAIASSVIFGFLISRLIFEFESLAKLDHDDVIRELAPLLNHALAPQHH